MASILGANLPEGEQPYSAIIAQNVFRLRPQAGIEIDQTHRNLPPVVRPSVRVTGFTDVCGRSQVLLEISEQGKPLLRPVLAAGEQFMGIKVEAVDVVAMRVRLRIDGESSEMTLQAAAAAPLGLKHPRK